jgi:hypothetical protein
MDHASWSMVQDRITERNNMNTLKLKVVQDERKRKERIDLLVNLLCLTPAEAIKHDRIFLNELAATLEDKQAGFDGHSKAVG